MKSYGPNELFADLNKIIKMPDNCLSFSIHAAYGKDILIKSECYVEGRPPDNTEVRVQSLKHLVRSQRTFEELMVSITKGLRETRSMLEGMG